MKLKSAATAAVVTILVLSLLGAGAVAPAASQVDEEAIETDTDDVTQSNEVTQSDETSVTTLTSEVDESSSVSIDDTVEVSTDVSDGSGLLESVFDGLGVGSDGSGVGSLVDSLLGGLEGVDGDTDGDESDSVDEEDGTDGTDENETGDEADDIDDPNESDGADDDSSDELDRTAVERAVHEAVNEERAERGLDELAFDTELRDIARDHSQDMAERGYFAHVDPDGNDVTDRYEAAGYECSVDGYTGGENIAQTWYDTPVRTDGGDAVQYETERELAEGIVTQWMNSPDHRENLLAPYWEKEGIGVYVTDDDRVFVTQNFC